MTLTTPDWEKFENDVCDLLGLDKTASSGSQWHDKGDGSTRDAYDPWPMQVDAKTTIGKSFSFSYAHVRSWIKTSELSGRRFAVPIRFIGNSKREQTDVALVPLDDLAELVAIARGKAPEVNVQQQETNFSEYEQAVLQKIVNNTEEGTKIRKVMESILRKAKGE